MTGIATLVKSSYRIGLRNAIYVKDIGMNETDEGIKFLEWTTEDQEEHDANLSYLKAKTENLVWVNRKLEMDYNDLAASADEARKFPFFGDVDPQTVARCIQTLDMWSRRNPGQDMQITFSTYGGNVVAGLALYDFIQELRARGHKVTTKALSIAASMGAVLLQAGDDRVATKNTLIMLHEGSAAMSGSKGEIEDQQKLWDKVGQKLEVIACERSGMTTRKYRALTKRKDCWLDATEALALGLIDRIEN